MAAPGVRLFSTPTSWPTLSDCTLEACTAPRLAKGLCSKHYQRQVKGRPLRDEDYWVPCGQSGCPHKVVTARYCDVHRQRLRQGTSMDFPVITRGSNHQIPWGYTKRVLAVGYTAAHTRVRDLWGSAKQYPCIGCRGAAAHWAYDGADPTQLLGAPTLGQQVSWYSAYPEFYMPMCVRCHFQRDGALASAELAEYRLWKYRTGKTLEELSA